MTSTLSTVELTQMRADQAAHFNDTCVIQTLSTARDSTGAIINSYSDGSAIACGFEPAGGSEGRTDEKTGVTTDAIVRVPIGTAVTAKDRIKITKRHGTSITALVFGVASEPQRGPSCLVIGLRGSVL